MKIIELRNRKDLTQKAAEWFHAKWKVPKEAYLESIEAGYNSKNSVPQWYVLMDDNKIIAGLGIIENDFHKRKDLAPNICAVYVEEEYRNRGIARRMLNYACADLAKMGYDDVYLITGHTGLYEKFGWDFFGMIEEDDGDMIRMYHRKTKAKKNITKIVITGGPCAGKTTGMAKIKEVFSKKGYTVLIMPETATELITAGISPTSLNSNYDYQLCQMRIQKYKESVYNDAVLNMPEEKFLIVCDRGMSDNKAYMTDFEFKSAVSCLSLTEEDIISGYNAVFHMVTAAKSPDGFYTLSNNCARTETKQEACDLDDRLIQAWAEHSYFRIVDNTYSFEEKINNLINEIDCFLADR